MSELILVNPYHITLKSSGHGEFPDSYVVTENGMKYLTEYFLDNIKGEIELSEEPMEYDKKIIFDSIKALIEQYEKNI